MDDDDNPTNATDDDFPGMEDDDDAIYGCREYWGGDPISRYYSSLRTMDEALREMFAALNVTGDLRNTIIMAAADHGETPGVQKRLGGTFIHASYRG